MIVDLNSMIYISIPKTGSNTVNKLRGFEEYNHIKAKTIKKKIGGEFFCQRGSFCFIRDPNEIIKSWYFYHKNNSRVPKNEGYDFYPETIEEWILRKNFRTHWQRLTFKLNNPSWDLTNPLFQKKWVCDDKNELIVTNIYSFKNFKTILTKFYGQNIKAYNSSFSESIDLSEECKKKVEKIFAEDLDLYRSLN